MALTVDNPQTDHRIDDLAKSMFPKCSKTRLANAILERAGRMDVDQLERWLKGHDNSNGSGNVTSTHPPINEEQASGEGHLDKATDLSAASVTTPSSAVPPSDEGTQ